MLCYLETTFVMNPSLTCIVSIPDLYTDARPSHSLPSEQRNETMVNTMYVMQKWFKYSPLRIKNICHPSPLTLVTHSLSQVLSLQEQPRPSSRFLHLSRLAQSAEVWHSQGSSLHSCSIQKQAAGLSLRGINEI